MADPEISQTWHQAIVWTIFPQNCISKNRPSQTGFPYSSKSDTPFKYQRIPHKQELFVSVPVVLEIFRRRTVSLTLWWPLSEGDLHLVDLLFYGAWHTIDYPSLSIILGLLFDRALFSIYLLWIWTLEICTCKKSPKRVKNVTEKRFVKEESIVKSFYDPNLKIYFSC